MNDFNPNYAVTPGETLKEMLKIHPHIVATALDIDLPRVLTGGLEITDEMAEQLDFSFGPSKQFWINRESQYREQLKKILNGKYLIENGKLEQDLSEYDYRSDVHEIHHIYYFQGKYYRIECVKVGSYSRRELLEQDWEMNEVEKHEEEITYTKTTWIDKSKQG